MLLLHNFKKDYHGWHMCQYCQKIFSSLHRLDNHINEYHEIDGKYPKYESFLKCSWTACGVGFSTSVDRINHVRVVHLENDPFICRDCLGDCPTVYKARHHNCQV